MQVPIFLQKNKKMVNVEVQFRTIAMDFWASLEHKIYYKFEGNAPDYISRDLKECADMVATLDDKMLQLNEAILACVANQETQAELQEKVADNKLKEQEELLKRTESV